MQRADTFHGGLRGGYSRNYQPQRYNFGGNISNIYASSPPPSCSPRTRPNFVVELRSDHGSFVKSAVEALITKCKSQPERPAFFNHDNSWVRLSYSEWNCALEAVVSFWESLFDGDHKLTPNLISYVKVDSDEDELNDRLKSLFLERIKGLIDGKLIDKWQKTLQNVVNGLNRVSDLLRKPNRFWALEELVNKKKGLLRESDVIAKRIEEFRSALSCIHDFIEGKELPDEGDKGFHIFEFKDGLEWRRIHRLIKRECRRLDDGLPIYAFRREILAQINDQQVTVLVGETGSGKSTQLVQFLADSGISAHGSIICTEPRKIAALSLANRVGDEVDGCYGVKEVGLRLSYLSDQACDRKVMFMTDHCLLQQCMNDRNLSGVSCIIVDEAHERSLNTDLLLTLVRNLLRQRHDLRLVIMSATADADQLSDYFFGCATFTVQGRNYPVDVKYVPCVPVGKSNALGAPPGNIAPFAFDVVKMAAEVHKSEKEGAILAFLTSQAEVEWACESFKSPCAVPIALHGKLSHEDQIRAFQNYPGKRKVIFATNIAETSLTIPGVKYVIDSGMVKESRFEPTSGTNVLRVCWISKSSAKQRAGRAGRTEPGQCYRLYSQEDFDSMPSQQEPEIRRVHLGLAVLKILALGVKNVQEFDFVDAPCPEAIDMAIQNLVQLGAVSLKSGVMRLTEDGWSLVKMGIEPRLGKLILGCSRECLGREGLVLAAMMANASSIFCRIGSDVDKKKSDCMKVPFCHVNGDLFTLLSVYKEWEGMPQDKRNKWCWENSINAKSMRRCHDVVLELEKCLLSELHIIIPSYWVWCPNVTSVHDVNLKRIILASLVQNVAMYTGYDRLGYEVALTGQHVQLHPSCSLLMFSQKPTWVVFGDILSAQNTYLVCVTAFDVNSLSTLNLSPPLFDVLQLEKRKLQARTISGFGSTILKKFCGKNSSGVLGLVSRLRAIFEDERIGIEVDVDHNEIRAFASSEYMEVVLDHVNEALEQETRYLQNECVEKSLYHAGPGMLPPVALFGAGAEIKHLELEKRSLTVDVFHPNISSIDDKELMLLVENHASGVCAVHKFTSYGSERQDKEKWGSITFVSPEAAERACSLNNVDFNGSLLKIELSGATFGTDRAFLFPAVKARVCWPRRYSRGIAFVKCDVCDVDFMMADLTSRIILGRYIRCTRSRKSPDSVMVSGIDSEASEREIWEALEGITHRRILDVSLLRDDAVSNPPLKVCEESLFREISLSMPKGGPYINCCRVQVFPPERKDHFMRAQIVFDGRLHLEAAKALEQIEGKVLPGFLPWQKIRCQQIFHSSVSCPYSIYSVIRRELDSLVASLRREGNDCKIDRNSNGSVRVKISANATKAVARIRRRLEPLMKGTTIKHPSLNRTIMQHLFSRDGSTLMRSVQQETGTYILFDRHAFNVKIFGPQGKIAVAEQKLVERLVNFHETKQLEIHLRRTTLRDDLMKEVVTQFGPELSGLKKRVPEADYSLDTWRHVLSIHGSREAKPKVEEIISEIAQTCGRSSEPSSSSAETTCSICLCEVEDEYQLQSCMHSFCRACLLDQCDSTIRNHDGFPIRCAHEGCGTPLWLTDLRFLLSPEKLEELFRASLGAFVVSSDGAYRYCPSPDCPSIYKVAAPDEPGEPFLCGACYTETCTRCHMEYHPFLSCETYQKFKEHPDTSLKEWTKGRENVKRCTCCGYIIEKMEGCNHIECRCGKHICWVCLESFTSSGECYNHLTTVHKTVA